MRGWSGPRKFFKLSRSTESHRLRCPGTMSVRSGFCPWRASRAPSRTFWGGCVDGRRHHFWQALAFEDGSLVTETVSNFYLEGEDCWTPEQDGRLAVLGWEPPKPPKRTNWIDVQYTTSPPVDEVARLASRTLKDVFGLRARDKVFVKLFSSPIRGDTPAACLADAG